MKHPRGCFFVWSESNVNNHQYYDKYKRDTEARAFYKSKAWQECRAYILERDNHLCQECLQHKRITPADMVHHIVELKDNKCKALDADNLISLCNPCHNKEHPDRGSKKAQKKSKIKFIKG
jgi:5-methylcytosine-specific restriction endonuclease McrA